MEDEKLAQVEQRIKYNANGFIDKYKARLVAKGFNQQEGIDYTKTFALVAKMVTVRTLLVVSSVHNWDIQQLDINNAFLYRDLHEEVYIKVPSGYKKTLPPNTICKLKKSVYGLKQANRQWFIKLTIFLTTLGIEFLRNSKGIAMTQRKYALDLIDYAGLQNEKPSKTPLDLRTKLTYTYGEPLADPSQYRTLVGKLIYLTISRPDIAFAAQLLSKFSQNPDISHLQALTRVIRYLKLSPGQGLFFLKVNYPVLHAYYDGDWVSCPSSKRSVSGFGIFLGNSLISWHSKKQLVVSRSSTQTDYRALTVCSYKITWICSLFKDLKVIVPKPVRILCDNISTIALTSNPIQHARMKHI
nr:retrovirus-related Pol polyprotein from transposon TNT 1-94 [Tanacetum cinerariifolium]